MTKINFSALAGFSVDDFPRRPALCVNNVAIDARQTDRMNSAMTERGQNVCVDFSGENHLGHLQGIVVGDAAAFNDRLFDAHFFSKLAQLLAAAVDDTDANADLVKQRQLFAQRNQAVTIFRHLARELDVKSLAFEALNVRQSFAE